MITLTTHEFATRVAIEDHARRQLKIRKAKVTGIISVYYGASIDTLITLPYSVHCYVLPMICRVNNMIRLVFRILLKF